MKSIYLFFLLIFFGDYSFSYNESFSKELMRLQYKYFKGGLLSLSNNTLENQTAKPADMKKPDSEFFIKNIGQWNKEVKYLARIGGMDAWITEKGIVYDFYKIERKQESANKISEIAKFEADQDESKRIGHVIEVKFVGTEEGKKYFEKNLLDGYYNYFIGRDPQKWSSHVPLSKEIEIKEIYHGISQRYYYDEGLLRYDLVVSPGVNPRMIKMKFDGQSGLTVNDKGELEIKTIFGIISNNKLSVYQAEGNQKKNIDCKFNINPDGSIGFITGNYDVEKELIIDPLVYSTFIGGSIDECANGIAVDGNGNAYITGYTNSSNFPTINGSYDQIHDGNNDVFVAKLSPDGSTLIYSTFLGGTCADMGNDIVIDVDSNVYITGETASASYPTTDNAYNGSPGGYYDVFITKINSSGSNLIYSTVLGGSLYETGKGISIDVSGNIYITGYTMSTNFPTTAGAYNVNHNGCANASSCDDVFVTKINSDGSQLIYSTFIGGNNNDIAYGIEIDDFGNTFVTGTTTSSNYPTTVGAYDQTHNGNSDAFVTKLNSNGNGLVFSTFIGGTNSEGAMGISLDGNGSVFITGITNSANYPTTNGAFDQIYNGGWDAFITKFNSNGNVLFFSTFIGGTADEDSRNIEIDGSSNAYVSGFTNSNDYPTTPDAYDNSYNGNDDVFFTKINSNGSTLIYSTFIGGSASDQVRAIKIESNGNIYITGYTFSSNYPTSSDVYDITHNGNRDVFVTKLGIFSISADTICGYVRCCSTGVGMSGIVLQAVPQTTGYQTLTTTTNTSGYYSFSLVHGINYTISPVAPSTNTYNFSPSSYSSPFLNCPRQYNFCLCRKSVRFTGRILNCDSTGLSGVQLVLSSSSGCSDMTATTNSLGNYSFTISHPPCNAPYTITPTLLSYTFTPDHLTITDTCFCDSIIVLPNISGWCTSCCPDNIVTNGNFVEGTGVNIMPSHWTVAYGTPDVGAGNGCCDFGYIGMWGNMVVGEAIWQTLPNPTITGATYSISFCARRGPGESNAYPVRFAFRASNSPLTSPLGGVLIGISDPVTSTQDWMTVTVPDWVADGSYSILTVSATNQSYTNDGDSVSYGHIDNICITKKLTINDTICGYVKCNGIGRGGVQLQAVHGTEVLVTTTNSNGYFAFPVTHNVQYIISPTTASSDVWSFTPATFGPIYGTPTCSTPLTFNICLKKLKISGVINSTLGFPIPGIPVSFSPGSCLPAVSSNSSGYFIFNVDISTCTPPFTIVPSFPGYVFTPTSLVINANTCYCDSIFKVFTGKWTPIGSDTIRGNISCGGTPAVGIQVTMTPGNQTTVTDMNGNYMLVGNALGTYTITPVSSQYYFNPSSQTVIGSQQNINFHNCRKGIQLCGYIKTSSGQGINNVSVLLTGSNGTACDIWGTNPALTNPNGQYCFPHSSYMSDCIPPWTIKPSKPGYVFLPDSLVIDTCFCDSIHYGYDFLGTIISGIELPSNVSPERFYLSQNYPNPFNPSTRIEYQLPENCFVTLKIVNVFGREIEVLVNEKQTAGYHSINWKPENLSSGVYFCRLVVSGSETLQTGKFNQIKKMLYIR